MTTRNFLILIVFCGLTIAVLANFKRLQASTASLPSFLVNSTTSISSAGISSVQTNASQLAVRSDGSYVNVYPTANSTQPNRNIFDFKKGIAVSVMPAIVATSTVRYFARSYLL
jgi:hypothetical protein